MALEASGIASILYSSHAMLAMLTKAPEFNIDEAEAKLLGNAIVEVGKHYDTGGISPVTLAWVGLFQAAAIVYAPRVAAVKIRAGKARAERRQAQAGATEFAAPTPVVTTTEGIMPSGERFE